MKIHYCEICKKSIRLEHYSEKYCLSCIQNPQKSTEIYFHGTEKKCPRCENLFYPIKFYEIRRRSGYSLVRNSKPMKFCSMSCANQNNSMVVCGSKYRFDKNTGKRKRLEKGREIKVGEKEIKREGYIHVWDGKEWMAEHRYKIEKLLDRKLIKGEVIHHRNGNKQDNRIENLQLLTTRTHSGFFETRHSEDIYKFLVMFNECRKILRQKKSQEIRFFIADECDGMDKTLN